MPSSPDPFLPRDARFAAGEALRAANPRERHADLSLPAGRDPLAVLAEADRTRLPKLLPERYRRMSASPFAFFRGAAAVMAADLAPSPRAGVAVQACGDCHIGNFGVARSPEGSLVFDINDFDETLPGIDITVDLKRLCSSLALAVFESPDGSDHEAREAARGAAHAYRKRMRELAAMSPLEVWGLRTDIDDLVSHIDDPEARRTVDGFIGKAGGEEPRNYQKLDAAANADRPPSHWRIADKPPAIFHLPAGAEGRDTLRAEAVFAGYMDSLPPERRALVARYGLADVVFKVVGVGSVGTFCALGLFTTPDGDPLFLQIKEAGASCLAGLTDGDPRAGHGGERVVEGQRLMQSASETFLGWTTEPATGRQFYVRHLKNKRLGEIAPLVQGHALEAYGRLCGATLARAHARSGDAATMAGYMGDCDTFDHALAEFALRYAALTRRDHAALLARPAPAQPA